MFFFVVCCPASDAVLAGRWMRAFCSASTLCPCGCLHAQLREQGEDAPHAGRSPRPCGRKIPPSVEGAEDVFGKRRAQELWAVLNQSQVAELEGRVGLCSAI